jgi:hypothetical protein
VREEKAWKLIANSSRGGARGPEQVHSLSVEVSEEVDAYQDRHAPEGDRVAQVTVPGSSPRQGWPDQGVPLRAISSFTTAP